MIRYFPSGVLTLGAMVWVKGVPPPAWLTTEILNVPGSELVMNVVSKRSRQNGVIRGFSPDGGPHDGVVLGEVDHLAHCRCGDLESHGAAGEGQEGGESGELHLDCFWMD